MEGVIVDRSTHAAAGHRPASLEGGIAGTECTLGGIHRVEDRPVLPDQRVIAHLVVVVGMGGLEGVDRRIQPVDRFVEHHHPGGGIQGVAEDVAAVALAVVGGVDLDPPAALIEVVQLLAQPLLQGRVPNRTGLAQW